MTYFYSCFLGIIFFVLAPSSSMFGATAPGETRWIDLEQESDGVLKIKSLLDLGFNGRLMALTLGDSEKALAVISTRPSDITHVDSYDGSLDIYSAYEINLETNKKNIIWKGFNYELLGDARLSNSNRADIVFKYDHCVECESETYLGSFYYNERSKSWNIRLWPNKTKQILIGIAMFDEPWIGDFAYAVQDFDNDNHDEIAVWFREQNTDTNEINEHIFMYTIVKGKSKEVEIKTQKERIKKILCQSESLIRHGQGGSVCTSISK